MIMFDVLPMVLAGVAIAFMPGAESAICPTGTVAVNVTSAEDVLILADALKCTGGGDFNVTWYSSLPLDQTIEVSDMKNMTITGSGSPVIYRGLGGDTFDSTFLDDGSGTALFSVSDGSTLSLINLVLKGGEAENGGAVDLLSSSSLYVHGCNFAQNNASDGGAIHSSRSTVDIDGSTTFVKNLALRGGAIFAEESNVSISGNTLFSHNTADGASPRDDSSEFYSYTNRAVWAPLFGGAIYANGSRINIDGETAFAHNFAGFEGGAVYGYSSEIHMDGSTHFDQNTADEFGGAVFVCDNSTVYMEGNTVMVKNSADAGGAIGAFFSEVHMKGNTSLVDNVVDHEGGAMIVDDSDIYMCGNTSFVNNRARTKGGAIEVVSSKVYILGNTSFVSNEATDGGAMNILSSEVHMEGTTVLVLNSATFAGGSLQVRSSEIYLEGDILFDDNSSEDGALAADTSEVYTNGNVLFVNNSCVFGGGMHVTDSLVDIAGNTSFLDNAASRDGGGMYSYSSRVYMEGNTSFVHNRAGSGGGAIYARNSTLTNGGMIYTGGLAGKEGDPYHAVGSDPALAPNLHFVRNTAVGLGGAIHVNDVQNIELKGSSFESNKALLGGGIFISSVTDASTEFSSCIFKGNVASEGGAMYLATGSGVDRITASIFRDNVAVFSGGAIFHTGSLQIADASFVANMVGVEGPAIISIGTIEEVSNVSFSENSFYCRAFSYGLVIRNKDDFCDTCFDEVCARCSTGHLGDTEFNRVRTNGMPVCKEPPAGAIAESSGTTVATLSLEKGYYRTSNQSHIILKCYQTGACLGGNDSANYCAPGYTGPYCAVCVDGYTPGTGYSCRECSRDAKRSAVGLSVAVSVIVLILAVLLFARLGCVVQDATGGNTGGARRSWVRRCWSCRGCIVNVLPLRAIKIVVTVWQIISQFGTIAGHVYPELYTALVSKLTAFNLDVNFALAYSCLVTTDFYHHLVAATIVPLVALVMLGGSYTAAIKRNDRTESAKRLVQHNHQSTLVYFAFFVYSPVSYKIFQTFACDELDDGNSYLRADYSLSCLTPRHSWYKAYALVMVAIYPVGIAAVFACLLGRYRHDLVRSDRDTLVHLQPLNGIWGAYRPSRFYYEVVECGRWISLTSIAAFVPANSVAQLAIVLIFAVVFVFISEAISPFAKSADMNLYRWGNGIVVASMYVAFLMRIDVGHDNTPALLTFSGVLIAANSFMVVTVLLQTALLAKEWRKVRNSVIAFDTPTGRAP